LANTGSYNATQSPRRNLGSKENQADILQDTLLLGLDSNSDDNDEEGGEQESIASGSFAFIEQLSQALKAYQTHIAAHPYLEWHRVYYQWQKTRSAASNSTVHFSTVLLFGVD